MSALVVEGPRSVELCMAVPGDKSISHRALILAAMARGETRIERPLVSADTLATLRAADHAHLRHEVAFTVLEFLDLFAQRLELLLRMAFRVQAMRGARAASLVHFGLQLRLSV